MPNQREAACLMLMLALPLAPRLLVRRRYPRVKNGVILAAGGGAILRLAAEIPLLCTRQKRKPAGPGQLYQVTGVLCPCIEATVVKFISINWMIPCVAAEVCSRSRHQCKAAETGFWT